MYICEHTGDQAVWNAGSLHNGKMDVDHSLWSLARRNVPLEVIDKKVDEYIAEGHLQANKKESRMQMFEEMTHVIRVQNQNAFHWSVAFDTSDKNCHLSATST